MAEPDLFDAETVTLKAAHAIHSAPNLPPDTYRAALGDLVKQYERLLRETRRLIGRSDRTERDMNELNARLNNLTAQLDYKAKHDVLTGVLNRGAIFERAYKYLENTPLSLIIIDIDFFKRINDAFGHPVGDTVIREITDRLQSTIGNKGDVGRIGGEEFIVLLPGVNVASALALAEKLRLAIANQAFVMLQSYKVTASFGVSHMLPHDNFEDLYARADEALYEAKHAGRNCVIEHTSHAIRLRETAAQSGFTTSSRTKLAALLERYAHLAPDHLAIAASRLDCLLKSYDSATEAIKEKRPASLQAA